MAARRPRLAEADPEPPGAARASPSSVPSRSAVEMALLYHPGVNTTRLYYGTDTHAQCLLVGASLAVSLAIIARERSRRRRARQPRASRPAPWRRSAVGGDDAGRSYGLHRRRSGRRRRVGRPVVPAHRQRRAPLPGRVPRRPRWPPRRCSCRSSAPSGRRSPSSCRSPRSVTSVASPTGCTCGTTRSSSGSTGHGPGSAATRCSACGRPPPSRSPPPPSTSSSGRSGRGRSSGSGGRWLAAPVAVVVTVVALVVATTVPAVAGAGLAATTTTVPAADAGRAGQGARHRATRPRSPSRSTWASTRRRTA